MPQVGAFDADERQLAEFDPSLIALGWYEYGLPFSHALIPSSTGTDYSDTLTLSRSLGLSAAANAALLDNLGLNKITSLSASGLAAWRDALGLAKTLGISAASIQNHAEAQQYDRHSSMRQPGYILDQGDSIALGRVDGLSNATTQDQVAALIFGRSEALSAAASAALLNLVTLARTEGQAQTVTQDMIESLFFVRLEALIAAGGVLSLQRLAPALRIIGQALIRASVF